jgi:hypothetical protein
MIKSTRLLLFVLAMSAGLGAFNVPSHAVSGTDLITICFRNRTIQVPFYLRFRYYGNGAVDGACPVSNP